MPTLKMYQTGSAFNVSRLFNPSTSQDAKDTMNAILEQHITAALSPYRAPVDSGGSGSASRESGSPFSQSSHAATWAEDYGAGRPAIKTTSVDAARLAFVSGGDHDGSSGIIRKDRMVNGSRRVRPSLWARVNSHLCAGTKVFAFCLGVVAFIAVV